MYLILILLSQQGNNMFIEMININLYNKNINGYEIKVNLYFYFSASHSCSTKELWWRARDALGAAPGFFAHMPIMPWKQGICSLAFSRLKAWKIFSFLGFSRFLQNQESLDTPVFPGIFPGFSAHAKKKAGNPGILLQNSPESQAPLAVEKTKKKRKLTF